MNLKEKIRQSIEAYTGRTVYVQSVARIEADKLLANAVQPCVYIFPDAETDIIRAGNQDVERGRFTCIFMRECEAQAESDEARQIYAEERAEALACIADIHRRGTYGSIRVVRGGEFYDGFRRIVAGYAVQIEAEELTGVCASGEGGEYSRVLEIHENGRFDVTAYDWAEVDVPQIPSWQERDGDLLFDVETDENNNIQITSVE